MRPWIIASCALILSACSSAQPPEISRATGDDRLAAAYIRYATSPSFVRPEVLGCLSAPGADTAAKQLKERSPQGYDAQISAFTQELLRFTAYMDKQPSAEIAFNRLNQAGWQLIERGQPQMARNVFARVYVAGTGAKGAGLWGAAVAEALTNGYNETVERLFDEALKCVVSTKGKSLLLADIARVSEQAGRLSQAHTSAEMALALDADLPQAFVVLTRLAVHRKDFEDARKHALKAQSLGHTWEPGFLEALDQQIDGIAS